MKILLILLLCSFILSWIGFAFIGIKKKNWSKIISIGGGFLVACFVFVIFIGILYLNEPPKPDKELYLYFYKTIMAKVTAFDEGYKPFIDAASTGKAIKATGIAVEIDQPIRQLWLDIDRVSVPDLKDKDAQKDLITAKKLISSAYLSKCEGVSAYIEYTKNPSVYSLALIENKAKDVQSQLFVGMGNLISSGSKLGINTNKIIY